MSGEVLERVDLDDLFEGWTVAVVMRGMKPGPRADRGEVARHQGELVVRIGPDSFPVPLAALADYWVYRVHPPLPGALGYYTTEDPDHEVIERTSTGWRSIDTVGTPLSDAEVRELGELEHYVRASVLEEVRAERWEFRTLAMDANVEVALLQGDLAQARAALAPARADARRFALAQVNALLRSRWWVWPVRVVFGRRFGAELLEMGEGR
ncbi:hypothetical protein [Pseudoclavibacter sp. 8L]|uniref:hypothetical protein n=1 Tax=Pseudoclavibacter sp. 8L TaxID=2653162 RepID=UPI0012F4571E|nr:hypothetical protein [Pseudoclavibacter sp. 8L]VXB34346.1 hypothetical protein PSCLAVI8L_130524 [Pseudoclavibacter sp. 8L]